jgi:phosphoribosylanthranilate isomerase
VAEAVAAAAEADAILVDSGRPGAPVRELGGTGRAHDWKVSARIRRAIAPVPLYLAGGLRAGNVVDAIHAVGPFGVDVCSGVRSDGRLDAGLLGDFVRAMSRGDASPS